MSVNGSSVTLCNIIINKLILVVSRTVEYVLSVAHEQVVSGTIIVWYVTVVTNSKTTYLVLSVKNCASKTSRKICCIVTCVKGKNLIFY